MSPTRRERGLVSTSSEPLAGLRGSAPQSQFPRERISRRHPFVHVLPDSPNGQSGIGPSPNIKNDQTNPIFNRIYPIRHQPLNLGFKTNPIPKTKPIFRGSRLSQPAVRRGMASKLSSTLFQTPNAKEDEARTFEIQIGCREATLDISQRRSLWLSSSRILFRPDGTMEMRLTFADPPTASLSSGASSAKADPASPACATS